MKATFISINLLNEECECLPVFVSDYSGDPDEFLFWDQAGRWHTAAATHRASLRVHAGGNE